MFGLSYQNFQLGRFIRFGKPYGLKTQNLPKPISSEISDYHDNESIIIDSNGDVLIDQDYSVFEC